MARNIFDRYLTVLKFETRDMFNAEQYISEAVEELIENYSVDGLKTADALDFDNLHLRCAYLYLYSTAHTHMVMNALNELDNQELFEVIDNAGDRFNLTSLGGGPGSDALGVLLHLEQLGCLESWRTVNVNVVDKYEGWERAFLSLMYLFPEIEANFRVQDMFLPLTVQVKNILQQTHFLSMVKFLSAI